MEHNTDYSFAPADAAQLRERGISLEEAARQIAMLRQPPRPILLDRPCTDGDGIIRLDGSADERLLRHGDDVSAQGRVTKFVPASGAATRMFKDLIALITSDQRPSSSQAGREFFEHLDDFAFADELRNITGISGPIETESQERQFLTAMLETLRYAELPKGLIPFHRVGRPRTAFEEHLLEGTRYVRAADGRAPMHFTVAPEFRTEFETALGTLRPEIEAARPGTSLAVSFSEQQPATDTLALDPDGQPFRAGDGRLLFRPAGHGALLQNLQDLQGDLVIVKNIDNIVPDEASTVAVHWKRLLIGLLAEIQQQAFGHLGACESADCSDDLLQHAADFARARFARQPLTELRSREELRRFVFDALDRPLRVCGVVRNEGEPGGAPFWVRHPDGSTSVQIVEPSQVDVNDPEQLRILRASTHFNPVDIVAGMRSYRGRVYDLAAYVDPSTAFLASKTYEGRPLTALERPGLWNGSMAGWNTLCVEVPAVTFAPVKTVFDLLRPAHQPPQAARRADK